MNPILKQVLIVLVKLAVLYTMGFILWLDVILMQVASPRFFFEALPFAHCIAIVLAIAALISLKTKSRTPLLWSFFCIAFSTLFLLHPRYVPHLMLGMSIAAAINFLFRNRITEPLLALLPLVSGTWLFLHIFYPAYLHLWIYSVTGYMDFGSAAKAALDALLEPIGLALVVPWVVMYVLGKHYYVDFYRWISGKYKHLRQQKAASPKEIGIK